MREILSPHALISVLDRLPRVQGGSFSAYAIALLGVLVATAVRMAVELATTFEVVPYATYFPAVLIVSLSAGARAGIATLLVGGVVAGHLFVYPYFEYAAPTPRQLTNSLLYVLSGLIILLVAVAYRAVLRELRAIYDNAPIGLAVLDSQLRYRRVNQLLATANGLSIREHLGKTIMEVVPNLAPQAEEVFRTALETGRPAFNLELSGETGTGQKGHWLESVSPLKDGGTPAQYILVAVQDITRQKEAERARELLAAEIEHRGKNLLTIVQGIVARAQAASVDEFKEDLLGRIQALGRVHALFRGPSVNGVDLRNLILEEVAAHRKQVNLLGAELALPLEIGQPLSLIIHELATNAVKYGALSVSAGTVSVAWQQAAPGWIRIVWTESGGPPVCAPSAVSFGMKFMPRLAEQMGAALKIEWRAAGLVVSMDVPVDGA